ncbi:very-long-chain (3R)-3-hydroxyacyl-CoA dehydratase PASTICCINO 2-like [Solanum dulcamara]|uniref:very-long-chain (3R)-3-hydroxyacyl-CoA dehydratase PASTICCINO 2-like n=1 Tax=Solanum dulcamara TaxID=45834 RepID=UPI0024861370|nr:very-long-chain (3R)-3-hydroxyacyl-CoA dehydratase PASTICCINO 2-like [Solanum dulcamara]
MAVFLSGLRSLYLIFYNWIVFFGWFQVFYFGVKTLKEYVYDAVEKALLFAQTTALMVRNHILFSSLVISWSITEIIRCSFFGTKEAFGSAPYWLLWLRTARAMIDETMFVKMQAVLTCIVTCLGRERKHSLIQKSIGHRRSLEDY